jgi:hypothetical protein
VPVQQPLRTLGYAANGAGDELALRMLGQVLGGMPIAFEVASSKVLASELVDHVREKKCAVVVIADLPPSTTSRTRYLVKKLTGALPDVRIVVARWSHPTLADDTLQPLTDAGASHAASTLVETRKYLAEAAHVAAPALTDAGDRGRLPLQGEEPAALGFRSPKQWCMRGCEGGMLSS